MARIVHIALKVEDLEAATGFYETVFGLRQTGTGHARGHVSRHLTDGALDVALMVYDGEDAEEAQLSGPGSCIHHWGIEVEDRAAAAALIRDHGGTILSEPGAGALKFRAPDGTVAEIVAPGRYKKRTAASGRRIAHLALEVADPAAAARFYETSFGFRAVAAERNREHGSGHMTDGIFDLALLACESTAGGAGPRIHHWGFEVDAPEIVARAVAQHGGAILSHAEEGIMARAPDGTLIEIAPTGRYGRNG